MRQGIESNPELEDIASFVIDDIYPVDVEPLSCILGGSRGYGFNTASSDYDFYGIHLMDTYDCLEHPDFRRDRQVIKHKYSQDYQLIGANDTGEFISLQSYEIWKFISMLGSGSFIVYELLYMPEIHHAQGVERIFELSRSCLTNRLGRAAIGICKNELPKNPLDRKTVVMCYYRLIEAIHYLLEEQFEWSGDALFEYMGIHVPYGLAMFQEYKNPDRRTQQIDYTPAINSEIAWLIEETKRAMVASRLPDTVPQENLSDLLRVVRQIRLTMI